MNKTLYDKILLWLETASEDCEDEENRFKTTIEYIQGENKEDISVEQGLIIVKAIIECFSYIHMSNKIQDSNIDIFAFDLIKAIKNNKNIKNNISNGKKIKDSELENIIKQIKNQKEAIHKNFLGE